MAHTAKGKALGDAFLVHLNAQAGIQALGLVGGAARWAARAVRQPVYPSNPWTDCPSLDLVLEEERVGPGTTAGTSQATCAGQLWYKRLQVPGQQHHQLLIADLEAIINTLMGAWRPSVVQAVSGQETLQVLFDKSPTIHEDLTHPDWDDPALRVSVAEVPFVIHSRAQ